MVGTHPGVELREMRRVRPYFRQRDLVRAPRAFDLNAVDLFRAGPSLRCAQHDHRPSRTCAIAITAGDTLEITDALECLVERRRAWLIEYPSSPPSWIDPGVSGATWLGTPPGNENWRKRRCMPSPSRVTDEYVSVYEPSSQTFARIAGPPCPGPVTYIMSRSSRAI